MVCVGGAAVLKSVGFLLAALFLLGLSGAAWLCWKNQSVRILDEETFEYTTFLGNKRVYSFSDIRALKPNSDSLTLIFANGKVHIESCAIISTQLLEKVDHALGYGQDDSED